MAVTRLLALCVLLSFAGSAAPVAAADYTANPRLSFWRAHHGWHGHRALRAHHEMYKWQSLIALLEANPDVDDGDKGPAIARAHARILRLRPIARYRPPYGPTPCCYSRKPLYIR